MTTAPGGGLLRAMDVSGTLHVFLPIASPSSGAGSVAHCTAAERAQRDSKCGCSRTTHGPAARGLSASEGF